MLVGPPSCGGKGRGGTAGSVREARPHPPAASERQLHDAPSARRAVDDAISTVVLGGVMWDWFVK